MSAEKPKAGPPERVPLARHLRLRTIGDKCPDCGTVMARNNSTSMGHYPGECRDVMRTLLSVAEARIRELEEALAEARRKQ